MGTFWKEIHKSTKSTKSNNACGDTIELPMSLF